MKDKMLDQNEILSRVLSPEEWAVRKLWYDQDEEDIGFIVEQLNITAQKAEELLSTARNISLNIFVPPIYRLLPEERAVFDLRNGFYGGKKNNIAAVAEQLHITLERTRELELGCDRKSSEQREPLLSLLSSDEKSLFRLAYGLEDGIFRDIDAAAAQLHITPEKAGERSAMVKLTDKNQWGSIILVFVDGIVAEFGD